MTIVDCDVHQGDGTATIFKDDPSVRTISFHCRDNFPDNKPVRERLSGAVYDTNTSRHDAVFGFCHGQGQPEEYRVRTRLFQVYARGGGFVNMNNIQPGPHHN